MHRNVGSGCKESWRGAWWPLELVLGGRGGTEAGREEAFGPLSVSVVGSVRVCS